MKSKGLMGVFRIALLAALLSGLLAGCGGAKDTGGKDAKPKTFQGIISTGSTEATVYAMGASMSKIVGTRYPEVQLTVQASGGGQENQQNLIAKRVEFGFVYGPDIAAALQGKGESAGKEAQYKELKGVFAFPYGALQIITMADSGMKTVADLKGKKVCVGAPGSSGATLIWPNILAEYGINKENTKFQYLNTAAAADALKDGVIDATTLLTKDPVAGITNVALTKKVRLMEIPHDATAEKIMKNVPGFYKTTGKQDLYGKNQVNEAPVQTLGLACILVARPEVPDEVVYKMTKSLFENLNEFSKSHASAKDVQLKTALEGIPLPVHPGAEKYFKEAGLIK